MFQRISLLAACLGLLLSACAREYTDPPARQTSLIHPPPVAAAEPSPPPGVPMPAPAFPIPQQKPGSEAENALANAAGPPGAPEGAASIAPDGSQGLAPEGASTANAVPVIDRDDPQRLVGLNEAQTIGLIGDPFIAEERPPARIWTFAEGSCRLQVFFYPDLSDQHFEALTVSFSGIADTDTARRACFGALLEKHGA